MLNSLLHGWVREVLVRRYPGDKALVVAKVSILNLNISSYN